jgi:hypothetical protein
MSEVVQFEFEGGGSVLVEAREAPAGKSLRRVAHGKEMRQAAEKFEAALELIKPVGNALLAKLRGLAVPANKVTVEFGLKVAGEAKFIIASAGAEANFKITLTWGDS